MREKVEHLIQDRAGRISERTSYGSGPRRVKG